MVYASGGVTFREAYYDTLVKACDRHNSYLYISNLAGDCSRRRNWICLLVISDHGDTADANGGMVLKIEP